MKLIIKKDTSIKEVIDILKAYDKKYNNNFKTSRDIIIELDSGEYDDSEYIISKNGKAFDIKQELEKATIEAGKRCFIEYIRVYLNSKQDLIDECRHNQKGYDRAEAKNFKNKSEWYSKMKHSYNKLKAFNNYSKMFNEAILDLASGNHIAVYTDLKMSKYGGKGYFACDIFFDEYILRCTKMGISIIDRKKSSKYIRHNEYIESACANGTNITKRSYNSFKKYFSNYPIKLVV